MSQIVSKQKRKLIIRFHVGLKNAGMMKEKPAILESFGVASTKELTEEELEVAIQSLTGEGDKWRKRVLAAIFGWCKAVNIDYNTAAVKAVACRASGYKNFNAIPVSRLRDIYYEWVRKSRTTTGVSDFKNEVLNYLESRN